MSWKNSIKLEILAFLSDGVVREKSEIREAIDCHPNTVTRSLDRLLIEKRVKRVKHGHYQINVGKKVKGGKLIGEPPMYLGDQYHE